MGYFEDQIKDNRSLLFVEDGKIDNGIEALKEVLASIDHDLKLQDIALDRRTQRAAVGLATELIKQINGYLGVSTNSKNEADRKRAFIDCYTKCASSINRYRDRIEAEPGVFNQSRVAINKVLEIINQFFSDYIPFMPLFSLFPVAKTKMNEHRDAKFKNSVDNLMLFAKPKTGKGINASLDTENQPINKSKGSK